MEFSRCETFELYLNGLLISHLRTMYHTLSVLFLDHYELGGEEYKL